MSHKDTANLAVVMCKVITHASPFLCVWAEVILCLNCWDRGPLKAQGCFLQPDLYQEFKCSSHKNLDFVEVDAILEKAFTCHVHENLTGFSLSPD